MKWQYYFDPRRWWAFIQGTFIEKFIGFHVVEQIMYRATVCSECTKAGKCVGCGCTTPDLYFTRDISCSKHRWGPIMTKENWETFKDIYNIKFKIDVD